MFFSITTGAEKESKKVKTSIAFTSCRIEASHGTSWLDNSIALARVGVPHVIRGACWVFIATHTSTIKRRPLKGNEDRKN